MRELELAQKSFPHQKQVYELSKDREFFALFMEQGTGKTKVIIDTASWLYHNGLIDAVMVICPNGLQENWHFREIPKFCSVPYRSFFRSSYEDPRKKEKEIFDYTKPGLIWLSTNVDWVRIKPSFEFLHSFLVSRRTLLVIDESTIIKNPKAARTKRVMKLGEVARYRRIMTGTPTPQGCVDLYSQMFFLSPDILPQKSFVSFKNMFTVTRKRTLANGRSFEEVIGSQNRELLSSITAPHCYRVLKKDCLELPEKNYKILYTSWAPEQERIYKTMKTSLIAELERQTVTVANATAAMVKLQQIIGGFIKDEDGLNIRVPTRRYSDTILTLFPSSEDDAGLMRTLDGKPKKTIIFFRFKYEIEVFKQALRALNNGREPYGFVEYTGDIKSKDRNEAVDKFQNDPGVVIFLATSAAARGLTLTEASRVVYFSQDYNLETRLQSEDRAHRIGQTRDVEYWNVLLPGTVDEKIQSALECKLDISNDIAKNWRQFLE